ncbi:uncharacterized protein H6S33_000134 [Morchella sextelata]|uniref:uncharacterized protein n=1 Tax=Morchella sextelata TaxID=1174677 RepID=UPI001D04847A|nr:uncharacterized protein H6S33_000134 [Morchella sextelata]KAH0614498.1 hypothetical protein H6S33_000134 [Morchella sextelata]
MLIFRSLRILASLPTGTLFYLLMSSITFSRPLSILPARAVSAYSSHSSPNQKRGIIFRVAQKLGMAR